ncbi:uncharacterized protein LOC124370655 [Homalodisca vitripennis]|uniref:uncharacterized protein LOC124370655 n=1 Tax=Homalodisca vitripennis TaxID=197043 RepID=UPI001EEBD154|nr:uncharacterized protein LOC124370655 [Homalodisca vitripennis]
MYSCRHLVLAFSVGVMTVSTALIAILCRARLPPGVGYTRLMLILVGLLVVAAPLVAGDDDGPPPRKAPRLVGNDDDPRPDPHPEVQDSPLSPDPDDSVEEYDSDATVENLIPGVSTIGFLVFLLTRGLLDRGQGRGLSMTQRLRTFCWDPGKCWRLPSRVCLYHRLHHRPGPQPAGSLSRRCRFLGRGDFRG